MPDPDGPDLAPAGLAGRLDVAVAARIRAFALTQD